MNKVRFPRRILAAVLALSASILALTCATPGHADGRTYTREDAEALIRTVWGEYRGADTDQIAGVAWCVLNRVDSDRFQNTILEVVSAPYQFAGYSKSNPIDPRIEAVVYDVLARWVAEPQCIGSVGRVLPADYLFFHGNGYVNLYHKEWCSREYWDWSWDSPYGEKE